MAKTMIETKRLILRPFTEADAMDLFEYLEHPTVNCFAGMKLNSLEDARKGIQERMKDPSCYLAIMLKENGKVIGEIWAVSENDEAPDHTSMADTFSPCWMLNGMYQKRGYAYEAAHAFFDYLFREKGARRLYAYTDEDNLPSQHLCEKLGMRQEGFFKEFVSFVNNPDGTPHYENTYQYAILRKEWHDFKEGAI